MEKVFLRVYNREIEGMIEGGQLDEAIAHCQHILKTFPMHVETYRLLGKAFLEARRYTDAADIFRRVLMSVPDDFVSHVGMSIIRDDEGKLDDAIWHMERAFEVQPSNSAIQGELRRLYGRRDGAEPSKIRLSRDALANMYLQGELFNQAIAELRSVLADDPNRPDLQVMLMRSYYRSGHKVETAELAATLLNKFPYCLDSLRVLVDVLPGTARSENTQVYRHRLFLLDPYSNYATDSAFTSDQAPDSSVNLERLDYRPGVIPSTQQPDWASSLGIKLNTEKQSEPVPGWMQNPEIPDRFEEEKQGALRSGLEPAANQAETAPEWMRTPNQFITPEVTKAVSPDSEKEKPEETIAKADIPDWLMSMAPKDIGETASGEPEEHMAPSSIGDDGIPEWLKPVAPVEGNEAAGVKSEADVIPASDSKILPITPEENATAKSLEPQLSAEAQPVNGDSIPKPVDLISKAKLTEEESLKSQKYVKSQVPQGENISEIPASVVPLEGAGDLLKNIQEPIEAQSAGGEMFPEWLDHKAPDEAAKESPAKPHETVKPGDTGGEEIPDWLKSLASAEPAVASDAKTHESAELPPQTDTGLPDWLKSIAPTGGAGETDKGMQTDEKPYPEETSVNVETSPNLPSGIASQTVVAAAVNESKEQPMTIEQHGIEKSVPEGTVPEAIEKPTETGPGTPQDSFQPSGEVKPLNIGDDALGWLESLAAKQGANPEELLTSPDDRAIEMPDWLRQPVDEHGETPSISPQELPSNPPQIPPLESLGRLGGDVIPAIDQTVKDSSPAKQEEIPLQLSHEPVVQPIGQTIGNEEDTMSWLERMSADQEKKSPEPSLVSPETVYDTLADTQPLGGKRAMEKAADEKTPPKPPPEQSELAPSEPALESTEYPPSSTKISPEELPSTTTAPTSGEPIPLAPAPIPGEPISSTAAPTSNEDITITSWLSKLDVEEALGKQSIEQPVEAKKSTPAEELPDWLKDIESPAKPVETTKVGDDLPDWLRHPISSAELESTPEPEAPAWLEKNIPAEEHAVPTMPEEWVPAESKPTISPEPVPESALPGQSPQPPEPEPVPVPIPVQPVENQPSIVQAATLSSVPVQDKDAELLTNAQALLDQDSLNASMKLYMKLIKKGRLLDEVIHDLREAIYRYPVDVIIWQTLGDAYMRANRLQDALDAYNKAEELLR